MSSKKELRQRALSVRRSIPPAELSALSTAIEQRLCSLEDYSRAKTIATYVAKPDEVQTLGIIKNALTQGKRVIIPKTDQVGGRLIFSELRDFERELAPGGMGILEPRPEFLRPTDLAEADIIIVPVVAWDERGYRLGYGKGYFDRELGALKRDVLTVGLALEVQRVEEIPAERYDVPLHTIITEERVIRARREAG